VIEEIATSVSGVRTTIKKAQKDYRRFSHMTDKNRGEISLSI
jgi:hypothetical protein